MIASDSSRSFDDPGRFIPIDLVNQIRPRVQAWREAGYAGTSGITKRLLEHWNDPEQRDDRFFFCLPTGHDNHFERFNIVPPALREQLRQGKVLVRSSPPDLMPVKSI